MKITRTLFLIAGMACGAAAGACGSGSSGGRPTGGSGGSANDASSSSGGTIGSAGTPNTDAGTGGSTGLAGGGAGGSAGTDTGAGTDSDAGADSGARDASAGASGDAALPEAGFEGGDAAPGGSPAYPVVPFPPENPFSTAKATLGKILFWDEQMSSDNTMACGTCHRAGAGGSDPRASEATAINPGPDGVFNTADDVRGAQGIRHCKIVSGQVEYVSDPVFGMGPQVTRRKPPSYLDAMFAPDIFWDGRATSRFTVPITGEVAIQQGGALESQSVQPPITSGEMACEGRTWNDIVAKLATVRPLALARDLPPDVKAMLAQYPTYPDLFNGVYGTPEISTKRIAFAIATHERRLTSDQTPWDRYNAGDVTALTAAQLHGFELFMTKARCNLCHKPPLFTDFKFHNLGFVATTSFDEGREEVTGDAADSGKVKTPTLRNVGLREAGGLLHYGTGPGASLSTVMHSYNRPQNFPNTDPLIQPLNLSDTEINDIIDFLRNGLTDPRVAAETPPFDRPKLSTEP